MIVFSKFIAIDILSMKSNKILFLSPLVIIITAGNIKAIPNASKQVKTKMNKNIKNILNLSSKMKSLNMFCASSKINNF